MDLLLIICALEETLTVPTKLKSRLQERYFQGQGGAPLPGPHKTPPPNSPSDRRPSPQIGNAPDAPTDASSGPTSNPLNLLSRAVAMRAEVIKERLERRPPQTPAGPTAAKSTASPPDAATHRRAAPIAERLSSSRASYTREWVTSQNWELLQENPQNPTQRSQPAAYPASQTSDKPPTPSSPHSSERATYYRTPGLTNASADLQSFRDNGLLPQTLSGPPKLKQQQQQLQQHQQLPIGRIDGAVGSDPDLSRRARLLLQHYQNGYHSVIPKDPAEMRAESKPPVARNGLASSSRKGDFLGLLRQEAFAQKHHPTGSKLEYHSTNLDGTTRGSSATTRHLRQGQQMPRSKFGGLSDLQSSRSPQTSRIASIIAEELQKDDDITPSPLPFKAESASRSDSGSHKPRGSPNVHRIMSEDPLSSASGLARTRPPAFHHSYSSPADVSGHSPATTPTLDHPVLRSPMSKRHAPRHEDARSIINGLHTNTLTPQAAFNGSVSPAFNGSVSPAFNGAAHSPVTLPAHLHSARLTSSFPPSSPSPTSPRDHNLPADEQPQDLSMKSRKRRSDSPPEGLPPRKAVFPYHRSPASSPGTLGYFSSPTSPEPRRPSTDSPRARTSPADIPAECGTIPAQTAPPRGPMKVTGLREKRGHAHGLDLLRAASRDGQVLVERRQLGIVPTWPDA